MSDYRKLMVWSKAHVMAVAAIRIAATIRVPHFASLKGQIIRAASSVPANIVEGSAQESRKEFRRYLRYALNSAFELEYHCTLAHDVGIIGAAEFRRLREQGTEVQKMLYGLIRRLHRPEERERDAH